MAGSHRIRSNGRFYHGLKNNNHYFLWVVRPRNTKGLIVSWYPQLEVLAHDAVGCFATHRGWNSTLEEFSLGVSMVAIPQWTDQETNAKNTEGVWKMGVRCVRSEDEILRRGAVEKCLREVMDGEQGKEIILYSREHYASSSKGGKRSPFTPTRMGGGGSYLE
ncbi:UDP-glycosyltransferase 74E2 [Linum perenne]